MNPKVDLETDKVLKAMQDAARQALNASLVVSGKRLRRTLSQPGRGKVYRIGQGSAKGRNVRERGYHRASAPGQPPAVNTNRLRASWSVEKVGASGDSFAKIEVSATRAVLSFGSNVPYAAPLEYGTRFVKKRPYIATTLPVLQKELPRVFQIVYARAFR